MPPARHWRSCAIAARTRSCTATHGNVPSLASVVSARVARSAGESGTRNPYRSQRGRVFRRRGAGRRDRWQCRRPDRATARRRGGAPRVRLAAPGRPRFNRQSQSARAPASDPCVRHSERLRSGRVVGAAARPDESAQASGALAPARIGHLADAGRCRRRRSEPASACVPRLSPSCRALVTPRQAASGRAMAGSRGRRPLGGTGQ